MRITILRVGSNPDIEAVRSLPRRYAEALLFSLPCQGFDAELGALPAPYTAPEGCLLIARRGSEPVGTVSLQRLRPAMGEIKRLYVLPDERLSGIARMLLTSVIDRAEARGYGPGSARQSYLRSPSRA